MALFPPPFKKLHSEIKEKLEYLDVMEPTAFQSKSIPVIKSGVNCFCIGPKEAGKTTTLLLTTLQKLKCEAVGTSPRAIVLVENMEKATAVYELFSSYTRQGDLRVYLTDEKVHIDLQKSEIFEGVDILITTPKAMDKLFLMNGLNTTQLKIFSIDDAEFLNQKPAFSSVLAHTQSIGKCQYVIYAEKMTPVLKRLDSYFMEYPKIINL